MFIKSLTEIWILNRMSKFAVSSIRGHLWIMYEVLSLFSVNDKCLWVLFGRQYMMCIIYVFLNMLLISAVTKYINNWNVFDSHSFSYVGMWPSFTFNLVIPRNDVIPLRYDTDDFLTFVKNKNTKTQIFKEKERGSYPVIFRWLFYDEL